LSLKINYINIFLFLSSFLSQNFGNFSSSLHFPLNFHYFLKNNSEQELPSLKNSKQKKNTLVGGEGV